MRGLSSILLLLLTLYYSYIYEYFVNDTLFGITYLTYIACFYFIWNFYWEIFSAQEEFGELLSHIYIGIVMKYLLFYQIFAKIEFFLQVLLKVPSVK